MSSMAAPTPRSTPAASGSARRLRALLRAGATPRHGPARIIAAPEIPRTRSGKISEVAVRETINGRPIGNDAALANPDCLAFYRALPALAD